MNYDLQIEDVSSIRRRLSFTIDGGTIKNELDREFRTLSKKVRLPGFRAGKVPRYLLEARFGNQVRSDVAGRLIERSYAEAAKDLDVAGRPAIEEQGQVAPDQPFTFAVGVDVRPTVEVSGYRDLKVPYPLRAVTEDEIDGQVERLLAGKARIAEVTDGRPVQDGDFVLTELVLKDGDEEVVSEAGTLINTRGERYYPGVEALLLGLGKDEGASGDVTIADSTLLEQLKGRSLQATVKVLGIQANTIPELTDELATELKYEGGIEGMRGALRFRLEQSREEEARNQAQVKLLEALVAGNEFDVPEALVEEQLNALVEELKVRRAYQGQDPRSIRFSEAEIADLRRRAVFAAKASCILASVAAANELEVNDADIDAKINEIAEMRGQAAEAIRGYLEAEGATGILRDRIMEEKTIGWLLENVELETLSPEELAEREAAAAPPKKAAAPAKAPAKAAKAPAKPAKAKAEAAAPVEEAPAAAAAAPSWNAKMKKDDLLAVARELGIEVTTKMKKDEIIEALTAHGG